MKSSIRGVFMKAFYKQDLDTPCLIIDLDLMESNISKMADFYSKTNIKLRPHMKTHKTPIITQMQIDAGAIGVTCQKLGEAEVFAQAGIKNILISNQIANKEKIFRLVGLSTWADVTVGIDDIQNAKDIAEAAVSGETTIKVAIEIDGGRCGVAPGEPALELAEQILKLNGLEFMGIWCHQAARLPSGITLPSITNWQERKNIYSKRIEPFLETKDLLKKHGIPVNMCSAGYTAVYDIVTEYPEITDVQAGSYVFMDWPYQSLEGLERFDIALSVLSTVISNPPHKLNNAYLDCGIKSISQEHSGDYTRIVYPKIKGELGETIKISGLSEEHASLEGKVNRLKVGQKVELLPAHCCTVTNLYDRYYCVRGEKVVGIWPILARGRAD